MLEDSTTFPFIESSILFPPVSLMFRAWYHPDFAASSSWPATGFQPSSFAPTCMTCSILSLRPRKALSAFPIIPDPRLLQSSNSAFSTKPLRLLQVIHSAADTDEASARGWALCPTEARRILDRKNGPCPPHTTVSPPITPSPNHNCVSRHVTTRVHGWAVCHACPLMLTSLEKWCKAMPWKKKHRLWHSTVLGSNPSSASCWQCDPGYVRKLATREDVVTGRMKALSQCEVSAGTSFRRRLTS